MRPAGEVFVRIRQVHVAHDLADAALLVAVVVVLVEDFADLLADAHGGIQAQRRVLGDVGDTGSAHVTQLIFVKAEHVDVVVVAGVEGDRAVG